jgi:xylulose-5-phosphate/fructose-6-phosphate phosphoketolase
VPFANARGDDSHRAVLEQWMRSYRPEELFDPTGDVRRGDRVERQQVG